MSPVQITRIRVFSMWETCQRTTFYVELTTDEGFTMTPDSFRTGSIHTKFEGLSLEEARDRALCTARDWGDFLRIGVEPFIDDTGVTHETSFPMRTYETQRWLRDNRKTGDD